MRLLKPLSATGIALFAIVGLAVPAGAHAYLESSEPVPSSVLLVSPRQVDLHFDEPVEIDFGSVEVIGPSGQRVDEGGARHPGNDTSSVVISLPGSLPRGTYVVSWRVISADSHPVHGAFVFSVGAATGVGKASSEVARLNKSSGSKVVGALFWFIRFGAFVGLLLLVGTAAMVALVWPAGRGSKRVRRLLWTSWWVLFFATALGIACQGVYAAELPLTDILRPTLWNEVLHTRFGEVELLRLILLAAVLPVLLVFGAGRSAASRFVRWSIRVGAVAAVGLLFTPGLSGHAATGDDITLTMALDVVHLGAAAVWLGGLAVLVCLLLPGPRAAEPREVASVSLSTSAYMFGAVAAVVATGVVQSIGQVGSFYALTNTVYGRTLLVKIGLVFLLVVVGALSRSIVLGARWLPWRRRRQLPTWEGSDRPKRLRRTVLAEIAIAFCVLGVTSLLVNAAPAKQAAAQPFSQSFSVLGVQVNALVSPAHVGPGNQFHFYVLGRLGQPVGIPELDASVSLASEGIGPIEIPLVLGGPGHYLDTNVDLPIAGNWQLKLTVRTSPIDEQEVFATVPVH